MHADAQQEDRIFSLILVPIFIGTPRYPPAAAKSAKKSYPAFTRYFFSFALLAASVSAHMR